MTPVKVSRLVKMLEAANYNRSEIRFLEAGFTNGFDIDLKRDAAYLKICLLQLVMKLNYGTKS